MTDAAAHPAAVPLPVGRDGTDALAAGLRLAREAGALVRAAASRAPSVDRKGRNNLVTETDYASEALLIAGLAAQFPDHAILSEERHPDTDWRSGWVWVLDPLDGTRNFVAGIPTYCVNVALLHDGEAVLGVTHDPNRDWTVAGGPGRGVRTWQAAGGAPPAAAAPRAWGATDLASAVVTVDLGYDDVRAAQTLELMRAMWPGVQSFRVPGSAALGIGWTAAGLADLNLHSLLYPWDVAAGLALIPAAGGVIHDRGGGPARPDSQGIVAGAPAVVAEFEARFGALPWRGD